MKKSVLKWSILLVIAVVVSGCGSKEEFMHIEAFVVEVLEEDAEGMFVKTGAKKSNAITTIEEGKNYIKTNVQVLEDYYDMDGKYMKTEILYSDFTKSLLTGGEHGENKNEQRDVPATILIPDEELRFTKTMKLTETEQRQVKEHVESLINDL